MRAEVDSGSELGKQLVDVMKAGQLVPLDVVLDLVKKAMLLACANGSKGFLIDGYPRDIDQGKKFESEVCTLLEDLKNVYWHYVFCIPRFNPASS